MSEGMHSPLRRARGLGSARSGVEHWWLERITAVALVPLTLWFLIAALAHAGGAYADWVAWLKLPVTTVMMSLLLIVLFHHAALGLQVVIEDYVHSRLKIPALVLVRFACLALAVIGIWANLRIAFG